MLILARKQGESLCLYDEDYRIEVMVCSISGTQVKIGITAPRRVKVLRSELLCDVKK